MSEVFKYATHRDIKKGMKWGKVIEKVKVTNLFDLKKSIEVEAVYSPEIFDFINPTSHSQLPHQKA